MSVEEKARELGQTIIEDERFIAYEKARLAQETSKELQAAMQEYESARAELVKANEGGASHEAVKGLSDKLQKSYKALMDNPVMQDYMNSRKEFEALLSTVNGIIDFYVTGNEQSGCSGSCSGCHGCG